jgi:hypothetical protein
LGRSFNKTVDAALGLKSGGDFNKAVGGALGLKRGKSGPIRPLWLGVHTTVEEYWTRLERAQARAAFRTLSHVAGSIRKDAQRSIKRVKAKIRDKKSGRFQKKGGLDYSWREKPSEPGTPPHTHRDNRFKRAVVYWVGKDEAIVGFTANIVGQSAEPHEKGKFYKGQLFKKRPTIVPAMMRAMPRFMRSWRASIVN